MNRRIKAWWRSMVGGRARPESRCQLQPLEPRILLSASTGSHVHLAWQDADYATLGILEVPYDFRDRAGYANTITDTQRDLAEQALALWSQASGGYLQFVRDTQRPAGELLTIGVGNLQAVGPSYESAPAGVLGVGGPTATDPVTQQITGAIAWLDNAETWDLLRFNGESETHTDFFTVIAHELGHALGFEHPQTPGHHLMDGQYTGEVESPTADDLSQVASLYTRPALPAGVTLLAGQTATSEAGDVVELSIVLDAQPTATVCIVLSSTDPTEALLQADAQPAAQLVVEIAPEQWDQPHTVTVIGLDDGSRDLAQRYRITAAVESDDPAYAHATVRDIPLVNTDDEGRSRNTPLERRAERIRQRRLAAGLPVGEAGDHLLLLQAQYLEQMSATRETAPRFTDRLAELRSDLAFLDAWQPDRDDENEGPAVVGLLKALK